MIDFIIGLWPYVLGILLFELIRFSIFVFHEIFGRWETTFILVDPETGRSHEIKEKDGKARYYINGIRVPEAIFNRF